MGADNSLSAGQDLCKQTNRTLRSARAGLSVQPVNAGDVGNVLGRAKTGRLDCVCLAK
jgi:hypothetical protein